MKPIFLTEEAKQVLLDDFQKKLSKTKLFDGKFELKQSFEYPKGSVARAKLWFTPDAWAKMISLVHHFSGEVGWQGLISRVPETKNEYCVSDILIYPQYVTGVTVDTDEEEFHAWLMEQQERYEESGYSLNFQAHSHVNMAVSPSQTDIEDQKRRMEDQKSGFYVFMIINKRQEANMWIYDYDNNVCYETKDIDFDVFFSGNDLLSDFMTEAEDAVIETKTTATPAKTGKTSDPYRYPSGYSYGNGYQYGYNDY